MWKGTKGSRSQYTDYAKAGLSGVGMDGAHPAGHGVGGVEGGQGGLGSSYPIPLRLSQMSLNCGGDKCSAPNFLLPFASRFCRFRAIRSAE